MIYVLGAALGASVVYGVMKKSEIKCKENLLEAKEFRIRNLEEQKDILFRENEELKLDLDEAGKCWDELKKINDTTNVDNINLRKSNKWYSDEFTKKEDTIKNLETKVSDLKEQLKLEDEASCRIIKELEDMVAELERENKLKDDKIAYEIGEKKNYIGYIDYVINAPRAIRRRFANGEKVDWIDENGVLRMRMVEEK